MSIARQPEFGFTPAALRELMQSDRGAILPRKVGRALLHRIPLWGRTGREEIREHLAKLISVQTQQKRLRKRLELQTGENLEDVIRSVGRKDARQTTE